MKLGTVVTLPDVALAELTASAVDLVWIDLEHGAISVRDVQPLAVAARAGGAESWVRLGSARDPALGRVLDAGVDGVVVPHVEDAAEAKLVLDRLRYPPRGSRGVAARRASHYAEPGRDGRPRCIVQIESEAGAAEADRIAAVGGVDALVVGCADLAAETGEAVAADAPRLRDAITRVRQACSAAGIDFGLAGPDKPHVIAELAAAPIDIAVFAADVRIYARALRELFDAARPVGWREAHVCA